MKRKAASGGGLSFGCLVKNTQFLGLRDQGTVYEVVVNTLQMVSIWQVSS